MNTRALAAETLSTALLLATVVGSGIMAERLAGGNLAVALLGGPPNPSPTYSYGLTGPPIWRPNWWARCLASSWPMPCSTCRSCNGG